MTKGKKNSVTGRDLFTTGQVAKICKVTIRTVIKWFEAGKLEGYKIPASKDRRIPREALLRFLAEHDYPYDPALLDPAIRVLVADDDPEIVAMISHRLESFEGIELHRAHSGYEAGFATARVRPHLLLIDYNLGDLDAEQVLETLARDDALDDTRVLVMTGFLSNAEVEALEEKGLQVLRKPLEFDRIEQEIRRLAAQTRRTLT